MPTLYLILIGGISAYFANKQGRNPLIWFAVGCFLPSCTLILLFILPIIGYFFKRKLLKTMGQSKNKPKPPQEDGTVTIDIPLFPDLQVSKDATKKLWYFLDSENKTVGPMSFVAFYQKWKNGTILGKTFVWNESLNEWKQFQEVFPQNT